MGFSKSQMPEKSFQVTRRSRVTWRDFSGMSDLEKPILTLLIHWIDIPVKLKVLKISKTALIRPLNTTKTFITHTLLSVSNGFLYPITNTL